MSEASKTLCSKCDGKGWIPNPNMDVHDSNSPDHVNCDKCGGDGFLYD
jgi:DnaJ-class molecular chaperone